MNTATKIDGTAEAWETGQLGADDGHVKVASGQEQEIDAALELHPISIRLQKGLLDNLKAIAQLNGLGYQPLVRQVLTRFVDCEMKSMLTTKLAEQRPAIARQPLKPRKAHATSTAPAREKLKKAA